MEGKKEVTLNVTNQPIQRLLDDVLHQRDLQYTMTGHSIVVTLKTAGKVKQVSGTVVDSNGEDVYKRQARGYSSLEFCGLANSMAMEQR